GQFGSALAELQPFFMERPAEAVDDHRHYHGPPCFDKMGRAFPAWSKRSSGALGKLDDPVILQCPEYLPAVRRIKTLSLFRTACTPGPPDGKCPAECKQLAQPGAFHGFFGRHVVYIGIRIQQVPGTAELVLFPPAHGRENMQQ